MRVGQRSEKAKILSSTLESQLLTATITKQTVIQTKKQDKRVAEEFEVNTKKSAIRIESGCLWGASLGDS